MKNNISVLATDFSSCDHDMRVWLEQRNRKLNIHKAIEEYIICLEDSLEREEDLYKRHLIEKEIKKLKKEKKKYYVPNILAESKLESVNENSNILENSKYSLVKKVLSEEHYSALEKSSYLLIKKFKK